VVISSWIGGPLVVVDDEATSLASVRVTSSATEATNEIAAMMAVMPTTHGHFGGDKSAGVWAPWS
jgi:hypothetical protein